MKKIKTPSTVAAPKSKRTSFPLLHKMTVPSSQTDLKKLGILTEKADIDDVIAQNNALILIKRF